jgi:uncharacterized MnhB-related membrane protein
MSVLLALDVGLAALVLALAIWTIFAREVFAAVVGYVAYGLLLSIVWVRLFAVDVALTEAAIGSGVTGVLLVGAAGRMREAGNAAATEQPREPQRFWAAVLPPLGILIGIHIFWAGADEPGGAFQGGAILATMWMITMMARLTEVPPVSSVWLRLALVVSPAVFLAIGVAGVAVAIGFFAYPTGFAKPLILFIEAFMTLSIAVTLPTLVAGPPRRVPRR